MIGDDLKFDWECYERFCRFYWSVLWKLNLFIGAAASIKLYPTCKMSSKFLTTTSHYSVTLKIENLSDFWIDISMKTFISNLFIFQWLQHQGTSWVKIWASRFFQGPVLTFFGCNSLSSLAHTYHEVHTYRTFVLVQAVHRPLNTAITY